MVDSLGWNTLLARSAGRGFLARQVFAIFTIPAKGFDDIEGVLKVHLDYQIELERRGVMFAAGPLCDVSTNSWTGRGLIVVRADSLEEATAIADADPMHSSGVRRYEIVPWCVNEGVLDLRLSYSTGRFELRPHASDR